MFLGDFPRWNKADLSLYRLPDRGHPSPLLYRGIIHVDVNGGILTVSDICQSSRNLCQSVHLEVSHRCLG